MKKFFKHKQGLVMQEFALMAPLYVMLFLGTLWLGEQSLARLRMVTKERMEVMNMTATDNTLWWFKAEKQVSETYQEEEWFASWMKGLSFVVQTWFEMENFLGDSRTITAQKRIDGTTPAVCWFRKNAEYGDKRKTTQPENMTEGIHAWKKLVEEELPGNQNAPTVGSLHSVGDYTRQANLVTLSGQIP